MHGRADRTVGIRRPEGRAEHPVVGVNIEVRYGASACVGNGVYKVAAVGIACRGRDFHTCAPGGSQCAGGHIARGVDGVAFADKAVGRLRQVVLAVILVGIGSVAARDGFGQVAVSFYRNSAAR